MFTGIKKIIKITNDSFGELFHIEHDPNDSVQFEQ